MKTFETKPTRTARKPRSLRFTPTAWAKLLFLRDAGPTEIGGFGISVPDDLLLVEDIRLVRQQCSSVHVAFDDAAVADFFDQQVDEGRQPQEFGRIWIHSHPASWADPSSTDEETFARVFGSADWALMFIVARGGQTYARLRFNAGPGGEVLLLVDVDYSQPFAGSDPSAWLAEYEACVRMPPPRPVKRTSKRRGKSDLFDAEPFEEPVATAPDDWIDGWYDYTHDIENLEEVSHERYREFR